MVPSALLLLFFLMQAPGSSAHRGADCGDWRDCQQRALAAAAQHQYETFHDLAWRAVQKGPSNDAALMYMLARAQSLSGRPHDALVMLMRLADRGVETDAANSEDFDAVRRLTQWPELATRLHHDAAADARGPEGPPRTTPALASAADAPGSGASTAPPAGLAETPGGNDARAAALHVSRSTSAAAASRGASPGVDRATSAVVADVLRVPALSMTPVALAHDRASGRFVFGDAAGRKLVIVDERMHFVVDLVREASAGFYDITAFEIDARRGDLWIVSADQAAGATALHHLQMVSGRPIERFEIPAGLGPGRFVDVAVTRDGIVYVLDAAGPRLFSLAPKAHTLVLAARLDVEAPASIAPGPASRVYIAHREGLARVNVRTGRSAVLASSPGLLPPVARIRWHAGALLGIAPLDDGTCNVVRVRIDGPTGRVQTVTILASGIRIPAPSATTVAEDALYYVSREHAPGSADPSETVVKRLSLRAHTAGQD